MDIFILDSNFNRLFLLDEFETFIWTERFRGAGDFQINVPPTKDNLEYLRAGRYVSIAQSTVIMEIEKVFKLEDDEGSVHLEVRGRGFEKMLYDRIVYPNWAVSIDDAHYVATGQAGAVTLNMIRYITLNGNGGSEHDKIPKLATTNFTGTTPTISISVEPKSLYDAVLSIATDNDFGFKITYRNSPTTPFLLTLYKGVDRPNVVYSSTLDNLIKESYLMDTSEVKNVAYVSSTDFDRVVHVYAPGVPNTVTGLDRKVMFVQTDIDAKKYTEPTLTNVLTTRGREALKKQRAKRLMDGEITNYDQYKFKVDYNLGDTIYIMDEFKQPTAKFVDEFTWAWDREGFRSYPTFATI